MARTVIVETAQSIQNFIDVNGRLEPFGRAQRGAGRDGRGVRSPGGEDRALLGERKIRMGNDIARMREYGPGVKQSVEVEYIVGLSSRRPHGCLQFQDGFWEMPREEAPARRRS